VLSQFFCTSLWFAGNAVISDIAKHIHINADYLAYLTSAVQAGFIVGTLLFALLGIADRFLSTRVFFFCAVIAAVINLGISLPGINMATLLSLRFATGFFLAGIYPVGMKIAAEHDQQGLGKSLGFLVGALVLGTAFPHLLKSLTSHLPWQYVVVATSALSVIGGLAMVLLVPKGPFAKPTQKLIWTSVIRAFSQPRFKAAALGYFGHMWELYAFWAFLPVILTTWQRNHPSIAFNVPLLSFLIIGAGALSCVASGYLSQSLGAGKTAAAALLLSCSCCIISPFILNSSSVIVLLVFLSFWSVVVIADSPMFSTLVAQNAPAAVKGSSLTLVNCIGFLITIMSIQLITAFRTETNANYLYLLLAIGPFFGLVAMFNGRKLVNKG
jgi:MFS family permease